MIKSYRFKLSTPCPFVKNMSRNKTPAKKKIAVFLGGRSPEHDVSVITGLQAMSAVDQSLFPVYITPQGDWLTGDILRERGNYLPDAAALKKTVPVFPDIGARKSGESRGILRRKNKSLFAGDVVATFDVALPAFHGLYGEDGNIQGRACRIAARAPWPPAFLWTRA